MPEIDKIFVIHVKEGFEARREHIKTEFGHFGLSFEFVLNDDVADLTEKRVNSYFAKDHCLKKEEISCSLKHYSVLERIKDYNYPLTLVFEDDVFLKKDFALVLDRVLNELPGLGLGTGLVISLGNAGNQYVAYDRIKDGQTLYLAEAGRATDSYIIDHTAAVRRLAYLQENKTHLPTGHMMNLVDKAVGNKVYWVHPTVVEQGSQNGFMKSTVSRNKRFHRLHWLARDFNKKYLANIFCYRNKS